MTVVDPRPAAPRPVALAAASSAGLFVLASLVLLAMNMELPSTGNTNVSGGDVLVPLLGVLLVLGLALGAAATGLLGAAAGWATVRWNLATGLAAGGLAGGLLAAAAVLVLVPAPSDRLREWCEFAALLALPPMFGAIAADRARRRGAT